MKTGIKASIAGLGISCSGTALAQPGTEQEPSLKAQSSVTAVANDQGDIGVLGALTLTRGEGFRLRFMAEKPNTTDDIFSNSQLGLDMKLENLTINLGTVLTDYSSDAQRVAVGFESKDKNRLRITYSETPSDEQFLIDGRVKLTDELTVQAAVDDSGNFRVRSLHEWGTNGISVAFGSSDTDFTSNVSFHTSQIWASTSYSESRGFGGRLVLGDIPKNRSDLFGEFSRPGANDISLVPDQTVRTFVGTAPAFGLLAFAPDTFLDDEPGSMVLDVRAQENVRASAQGTLRLGDLGPLQSSWVSAGAFYDLSRESLGGQVEIGTKIGAVDLRIQAEFNEQEEAALGLYLKVAF